MKSKKMEAKKELDAEPKHNQQLYEPQKKDNKHHQNEDQGSVPGTREDTLHEKAKDALASKKKEKQPNKTESKTDSTLESSKLQSDKHTKPTHDDVVDKSKRND